MRFGRRGRPTSRSLLHAIVRFGAGPLSRGVRATQADRYVKRYKSRHLATALICRSVLKIDSLRQLKHRLDSDTLLRRHVQLGGISHAQLPRLLQRRPSALWRPLIEQLISRLRGHQAASELRSMDTSFFIMSAQIFSRVHGRSFEPEAAGMKLGLIVDPGNNAPVRWHVQVGQGNDIEQVNELIPPDDDIKGLIYIFDRGFLKLDFYAELIERGAHFVTRAQDRVNAIIVDVASYDRDHPEIIADQTVLLGTRQRRGRLKQPIRRITVKTGGESLTLWSSDLNRPAHEIADLYRQRWQIEVVFRWIKRAVGCLQPLGYSQNAAEHTLYAALVAFLLALLVAQAQADLATNTPATGIKRALTTIAACLYTAPPRELLQALDGI